MQSSLAFSLDDHFTASQGLVGGTGSAVAKSRVPELGRIAVGLLGAGAAGAAIARVRGGDLVSCAAVGVAPPVGTVTPVQGTLTGRCVLSGELLVFGDTNPEYTEEVSPGPAKVASIIIAPIKNIEERVLGIVIAWFTVPLGIATKHLCLLKEAAEYAAEFLPQSDESMSKLLPWIVIGDSAPYGIVIDNASPAIVDGDDAKPVHVTDDDLYCAIAELRRRGPSQ